MRELSEIKWEKGALMIPDMGNFPVLFTAGYRVDLSFGKMYDIRHADDDWGYPVAIEEHLLVNRYGSILCKEELPFQEELSMKGFIDMQDHEMELVLLDDTTGNPEDSVFISSEEDFQRYMTEIESEMEQYVV